MNDNNNNDNRITHILLMCVFFDPKSIARCGAMAKACIQCGNNMEQIETEIKPFSMSFALCNGLGFFSFVCLFVRSRIFSLHFTKSAYVCVCLSLSI